MNILDNDILKPNEYYLTLFKERIIKKICNDNVSVKLISPKEHEDLEIEDVLLGGKWIIDGEVITEQGHVFDYKYVDKTTTDTKTFVCVEALPTYAKYPTIDVLLYIHIYVHKDIMHLYSSTSSSPSIPTKDEMSLLGYVGNRCDQLTQSIGRIMNGSTSIGGISEVKPYERGYIILDIPNSDFYGKCMIYKVKISDVGKLDCEDR